MNLSERFRALKPSATFAVAARAAALQKAGVNVLSLGAGEPDFDTPAHIKDAAKRALDAGYTKYTAEAGIPALREAVAEKLASDNGAVYDPNQVAVTVGGKFAVFAALQGLVNPGDEVIVPSPYWVSYPPMVELAGGRPVYLRTREEDGFRFNAEALDAAVTSRTRAVILNSPSNPTGAAYGVAELERIAEVACRRNLWVVTDELYEKLIYGGVKHVCLASLGREIYERTIVVNGFSKAYAMTGWRLGYMAGPRPFIEPLCAFLSQTTSNPTSIAQHAGLVALTGPQNELLAMRDEFEARRDDMVNRLRGIAGVSCATPPGAFFTFPNVSRFLGRAAGGRVLGGTIDLAAYLLEEHHVATVPGIAFGAEGHLRLSYATSRTAIAEGVRRLAAGLAAL
ncbi:MAG: pyridoxal phosphate-dependent aminotransferase [Deltaproteobacteria bacterium]|nr:pyridoxal phosphate-dependent aminotransferase [Deltaproteobacteria bacterium]